MKKMEISIEIWHEKKFQSCGKNSKKLLLTIYGIQKSLVFFIKCPQLSQLRRHLYQEEKEVITSLICFDGDESERMLVLNVGKYGNPRCFKGKVLTT